MVKQCRKVYGVKCRVRWWNVLKDICSICDTSTSVQPRGCIHVYTVYWDPSNYFTLNFDTQTNTPTQRDSIKGHFSITFGCHYNWWYTYDLFIRQFASNSSNHGLHIRRHTYLDWFCISVYNSALLAKCNTSNVACSNGGCWVSLAQSWITELPEGALGPLSN